MEPMNVVANFNILDRGDGPAQEVLDRTARNRAQRKQDETREELTKISGRVGKALDHYDASTKPPEPAGPSTEYVNDLEELEGILNDNIKKRKYQQQVTIFVVGYQNTCNNRLKVMQQVNDFFNEAPNRFEEEEVIPKSPDIDMDEVQQSVNDSLETAKSLTGRINDLNKEMIDYMYQYASAKFGNKNRKKLEKALNQAKEDVELMSEKLMGVQKELEDKDEKIQQMFKQIELKTMEAQRYKTAAEVAKKSIQESNASSDAMDAKDREIKEMQKKIDSLQLEIAQKESSRESTQKELLTSGREAVVKIKELEDKLSVKDAEQQAVVRDMNDYHDRQIANVSNMHREELKELKESYESEINRLKQSTDKQSLEIRNLLARVESAETAQAQAVSDLEDLKTRYDIQLSKENSLLMEREDFRQQISEMTTAKSARIYSASSSIGSDALKSDLDQSEFKKGGRKKKGADSTKSVSVLDDETVKVLPPEPEPADVKLPEDFTNEEKWNSYPMNQAQSAFSQYRAFALERVGQMDAAVTKAETKAAKRVTSLKSQFAEHKSRWLSERNLLINQIELAQKLINSAERETESVIKEFDACVAEAENLEQEDQADALRKQSLIVAAKQSTASPEPVEPTAVSEPEVTTETDPELLMQTDDAKSLAQGSPAVLMQVTSAKGTVDQTGLVSPNVENWDPRRQSASRASDELAHIRSAASMRSRLASQKSTRSVKFTDEADLKPKDNVITSLKTLMEEDTLDTVQSQTLALLRQAMQSSEETPSTDIMNSSLAVFGLAMQFSVESLSHGYKPDGFFNTIIRLYGKAAHELHVNLDSDPNISDLTKMIVTEIPIRKASAPGSPSGRSSPYSKLSNKYRASISSAKQSIADRRSASPQIIVPSKSSLEDAELNDGAVFSGDEADGTQEKRDRTTSVGSSLHAVSMYDKSTAISAKTEATAVQSSNQSRIQSGTDQAVYSVPSGRTTEPSAKTRDASGKSMMGSETSIHFSERTPSVAQPEIADATTSVTPVRKPSAYDMTTSVTPKHVVDRPTSYMDMTRIGSRTPEHPAVEEYVALYKAVNTFKNNLAQLLNDKDMMSSSQVISEMELRELDEEQPLLPQIELVSSNCRRVLDDCCDVVVDALNAAFREFGRHSKDYNVSSLVSREASYIRDLELPHSRAESLGEGPPATPTSRNKARGSAGSSVRRTPPIQRRTPVDTTNFPQLQDSFSKLQEDFEKEVKNHQEDVTHNTVLVMELQDTVQNLKEEIEQLREQADARAIQQDEMDSAIMFTRLDAERNAKNLKRAIANSRLAEDKYQVAVDKMEEYISLPAKRLAELVKKYVHHTNMQRIEEVIRNRENIHDSELHMLERMESLQNLRTQRWIEKMDSLGDRRAELAADLMETLEDLEQESGIFMIKPMFSYRGIKKLNINKAAATQPKLEEKLAEEYKRAAEYQKKAADSHKEKAENKTAWATQRQHPSVLGNSWNMAASLPNEDSLDNAQINTPKILELDVARMMYGQNQVSMKSNPYLNPTNTRSYVTLNASPGRKRPTSSENILSKSTPQLPSVRRSGSADISGATIKTPPLPPIQRNFTQIEPADLNRDDSTMIPPSRLNRDFTDDSIHQLPTHVTRVIALPKDVE